MLTVGTATLAFWAFWHTRAGVNGGSVGVCETWGCLSIAVPQLLNREKISVPHLWEGQDIGRKLGRAKGRVMVPSTMELSILEKIGGVGNRAKCHPHVLQKFIQVLQ